ncbi:Alpha/Beta hydrolase protein [Cubamyces lactineus]|nr:Alpha/Beta hydrolase protein [Cubamyces lactineus]
MTIDPSSGLGVFHDSGAPKDSTDYTTLVILHGFTWHAGTFVKLIPLGARHNTRVILVNRRDYTGSKPYSEEERALLPPKSPSSQKAPDPSEIAETSRRLQTFMMERAGELYAFLAGLVQKEQLPPANPESNRGGIVVAGWSFATAWMTALLMYVSSLPPPSGASDLSRYVRRVVFLDASYRLFGFPDPANGAYQPLLDDTLTEQERAERFPLWLSGYFHHGNTLETLEQKTPLENPPPTFTTFAQDELASMMDLAPGDPGGSDMRLLIGGLTCGLFGQLKKGALYLPARDAARNVSAWPHVEVRFVRCESSLWETQAAYFALEEEMAEAKEKGLPLRNVKIVHVPGANHFVAWDKPELAIRSLVGEEGVVA